MIGEMLNSKVNIQPKLIMKTNDLAIISSVALTTAALTVAFLLPGSLNAGNDNAPAQIVQPKVVSNGVEFTLTAVDGKTFKAGDEPAFELKAVNTTAENAEATVNVSMTSMAPQSRISRMVMIPQPFWQKSCPVTLKPNETKTIALDTKTKLPENSTINVMLGTALPQASVGNQQTKPVTVVNAVTLPFMVVALTYSTLQTAQSAKPAVN